MAWLTLLDKKIADYLPDMTVAQDEPLSRHCSFRIGGAARRMAFPKNGEQLILLQAFAEECGARTILLGRGSNVLFPDEGLDALVISTEEMDEITSPEPGLYVARAGATLNRLALQACRDGYTGLEFAHGIPGSVGGGVCMNAGAYDGELRHVIEWVEVLFPEEGVRRIPCEEMAFGYRHSLLSDHPEAIVLSAAFRLTKGDSTEIRAKMDELMARRKKSQPLEFPSAGSTFKRPAGYFAGRLIEEADCKGLTVGGAQVSEKHAGFVVNRGDATCADVRGLIAEVQRRVYERSGVMLEPEVCIIEK